MTWLQQNVEAQDAILKSKRMVLTFSIKKHTSPSAKLHKREYPSFMEISAEGQTEAAELIDNGTSFTTPSDANGIFGLLLHNIQKVDQVKLVSVTADVGSVSANAIVTESGNIAIDCDSDQDLGADTTSTINFILEIDYKLK
jgi:hypothetical protein